MFLIIHIEKYSNLLAFDLQFRILLIKISLHSEVIRRHGEFNVCYCEWSW